MIRSSEGSSEKRVNVSSTCFSGALSRNDLEVLNDSGEAMLITSNPEPSLLIAAMRSRDDRPMFLSAWAGDSL